MKRFTLRLFPAVVLSLATGIITAAPINEIEPNDTLTTAQNLDKASYWTLDSDSRILDSKTIPHVSIKGQGDGTYDFYKFTAPAGARGMFDIDQSENLDAELFLFTLAGEFLDLERDSLMSQGAGGSSTTNDPFLDFVFETAGEYIIGVAAYYSWFEPDEDNRPGQPLIGEPPIEGDKYVLQISIEGYEAPAPTLIPGDANKDGKVDFADFLILKNNFAKGTTWEQGNFNDDGKVDFADFLQLKNNFGKAGSVDATAAAVPEPSTLLLALLGLVGLALHHFKRRRPAR